MNINLLTKYIQLGFFILLSGLLIFICQNIYAQVFGMILLCIGAIALSDFNLTHPYFWYSSIFTLYSVSYPILYINGMYESYGYSNQLMMLQWSALSVFLIIVSPEKVLILKNLNSCKNTYLNQLLFNFLYTYLILVIVGLSLSNFNSKGDIYTFGNLFYYLGFRIALVITVLYVYLLINDYYLKNSVNIKLIIMTSLILSFIVLFSGERDIIFRFVVVTIIILYYFEIIKNKHLSIIVPIGVLTYPLTHVYKYYFLSGKISGSYKIENWLISFLTGEFVSASRNLQVLLNNVNRAKGLFGGATILNSFLRPFYDIGLSATRWFNITFFPNRTKGYGFTLVGEGYINNGFLGVVIVFAILAFIIRYLYKESYKNIYKLTLYIYSIPIFMYSIRADLNNVTSPFVRQLLLTIMIVYTLNRIVIVKKSS